MELSFRSDLRRTARRPRRGRRPAGDGAAPARGFPAPRLARGSREGGDRGRSSGLIQSLATATRYEDRGEAAGVGSGCGMRSAHDVQAADAELGEGRHHVAGARIELARPTAVASRVDENCVAGPEAAPAPPSPWPTARKVTVMPDRALRQARCRVPANSRDRGPKAPAPPGRSAGMHRRTPVLPEDAGKDAGRGDHDGGQRQRGRRSGMPAAWRRRADRPATRAAGDRRGTSRVATGMAARPGSSPSAFASTETSERRWKAAASSGRLQSAAASVAQARPRRCSVKVRHQRSRPAEEAAARAAESASPAGFRPAIPVADKLQGQIVHGRRIDRRAARDGQRSVVEPVAAAGERGSEKAQPTRPPRLARRGQGPPSSKTSNAAKGRATAAPNRRARTFAAHGVRSQARRASLANHQRHHGQMQPRAGEEMHEAALRQLVLRLARQPAAISHRQRGDQSGPLRNVHTASAARRTAPAARSKEAQRRGPRSRTSITSALALDGDPTREELRPPISSARCELAGGRWYGAEEPRPDLRDEPECPGAASRPAPEMCERRPRDGPAPRTPRAGRRPEGAPGPPRRRSPSTRPAANGRNGRQANSGSAPSANPTKEPRFRSTRRPSTSQARGQQRPRTPHAPPPTPSGTRIAAPPLHHVPITGHCARLPTSHACEPTTLHPGRNSRVKSVLDSQWRFVLKAPFLCRLSRL